MTHFLPFASVLTGKTDEPSLAEPSMPQAADGFAVNQRVFGCSSPCFKYTVIEAFSSELSGTSIVTSIGLSKIIPYCHQICIPAIKSMPIAVNNDSNDCSYTGVNGETANKSSDARSLYFPLLTCIRVRAGTCTAHKEGF